MKKSRLKNTDAHVSEPLGKTIIRPDTPEADEMTRESTRPLVIRELTPAVVRLARLAQRICARGEHARNR